MRIPQVYSRLHNLEEEIHATNERLIEFEKSIRSSIDNIFKLIETDGNKYFGYIGSQTHLNHINGLKENIRQHMEYIAIFLDTVTKNHKEYIVRLYKLENPQIKENSLNRCMKDKNDIIKDQSEQIYRLQGRAKDHIEKINEQEKTILKEYYKANQVYRHEVECLKNCLTSEKKDNEDLVNRILTQEADFVKIISGILKNRQICICSMRHGQVEVVKSDNGFEKLQK
jgi:hypothetical protein